MDWKTIEEIAKNPNERWLFKQKEVAVLLGCTRQLAAAFLQENSVPYYRIGREKKYFLPEVLDAVKKTRWSDSPNIDSRVKMYSA